MCIRLVCCLLALFATATLRAEGDPKPLDLGEVDSRMEVGAAVRIALLLDTSSSMSGLINQARAELWEVVNTAVRKRGSGAEEPIQIALYEYGNSGLAPKDNWIRQVTPLTSDLDKVSEALFALRTRGGSEYCGAVIDRALGDLRWGNGDAAFRGIFIAGNEPFTQGPVDWEAACAEAAQRGISVYTIHCGPEQTGKAGKWAAGARIGGGKYFHINQNRQVAQVAAPQDKQIRELNRKLNDTYIPYGAKGEAGLAQQRQQDANAAKVKNAIARFATKASGAYRNAGWDLVDAVTTGKVKLADIPREDLPEAMREMSLAERRAHIEKVAQQRSAIKKQIAESSQQRSEYIRENQPEAPAADSLGAQMMEALK